MFAGGRELIFARGEAKVSEEVGELLGCDRVFEAFRHE
jgi:hypothetical protein